MTPPRDPPPRMTPPTSGGVTTAGAPRPGRGKLLLRGDPAGHFCVQCGERLDDAKLAKNPDARFCSRECFHAHRKAHPELYRRQREATARANRRRWEEWRAQGVDPAHGDKAAEKRGEKIAASNRERPRRRKG